MIKVGFITGLKSGDRIVVPGRASKPLRIAGQATTNRFGGADAASRKLLRKLVALGALRKQDRKD